MQAAHKEIATNLSIGENTASKLAHPPWTDGSLLPL
jgi:hypothetical protein